MPEKNLPCQLLFNLPSLLNFHWSNSITKTFHTSSTMENCYSNYLNTLSHLEYQVFLFTSSNTLHPCSKCGDFQGSAKAIKRLFHSSQCPPKSTGSIKISFTIPNYTINYYILGISLHIQKKLPHFLICFNIQPILPMTTNL